MRKIAITVDGRYAQPFVPYMLMMLSGKPATNQDAFNEIYPPSSCSRRSLLYGTAFDGDGDGNGGNESDWRW